MVETFEKLDTTFEQIDYILHLSDVHIRLTKRHEEYREVFNKVYEEVNKTPQNTLVVNTGDLTHSKTDLSPECVQLMGEFLKNCADLRPTILIAGNHDCLLTNTSRLDSLSPVVEALNHSNLYYLKESKLYSFANILINNMSIFTDPTKYIRMKDVSKKIKTQFDTKIALFHGGVRGSITDVGFVLDSQIITTEDFDGHDMVLLGDIHKAQDLFIRREVEESDLDFYIKSGEWEIVEEIS